MSLFNCWAGGPLLCYVLPLPWTVSTSGQHLFENWLSSLLSLIPIDVSKGECKALSPHHQEQLVSRALQKKGGSEKEGSGGNGGEPLLFSQKDFVSFCFWWVYNLWIICQAVGHCQIMSLEQVILLWQTSRHDFSIKKEKHKWEVAAHCSVA